MFGKDGIKITIRDVKCKIFDIIFIELTNWILKSGGSVIDPCGTT